MKTMLTVVLVAMCACLAAGTQGQSPVVTTAVVDPGPRGGSIGAGGFLPGLTAAQLAQAQDGAARFVETETFPGGLGPFYNSGPFKACGECHAQPAIGGTSPSLTAYPFVGQNPQATVDYNADGAINIIPPFITPDGPVREMRLKYFHNADGSLNIAMPDGGVHDLFTVTGRADNTTCTLAQPNFAEELALGNASFRIPTPVFGLGLIENIPNEAIITNMNANPLAKLLLGISGHTNTNPNDGTITRFGWKAQNKSGLVFAGEAYNVEDGVSNELFPTERPMPGSVLPASCRVNLTPEDTSNPSLAGVQMLSDIEEFAAFMRDLAAPAPSVPLGTMPGQQVFNEVGCALCHTPVLVSGPSSEATAISSAQVNLFSDLLVHNLGVGLADGVTQGTATGQEFRSAPLWGVGQRAFLLHDGRCTTLPCAIQAHASQGSEANTVIGLFNHRSPSDQQALIAFLRSL
jgi:CxxC motif-containing protein (DUF1111 family)